MSPGDAAVDSEVTLGNGEGADRVIIRGQYLQLVRNWPRTLVSYFGLVLWPIVGLAMDFATQFLKPGERAIIPHSHTEFPGSFGRGGSLD